MARLILTCALVLAFWTLASATSPVCDRTGELGRKSNGRQIWCYTMNGDKDSCENSYVVRNNKRHACVFNPNMATFSNMRRRNPTPPGRCILEKRMAKFECGLLNSKKIVSRGYYSPPGPDGAETKAQCLARKGEESLNVNFKIDCEAEAEAEADANEDELPGLGSEDNRPAPGEPVAHHINDVVDMEFNAVSNRYQKPTEKTDEWNAGFAADKYFAQDDEVQGISFKPLVAETVFWVGLQDQKGDAERGIYGHSADFVFALSPGGPYGTSTHKGWVEIWEDGQHVHTVTQWVDGVGHVGRWNADSLFEIVVNCDDKVEYKMDGEVVYTSGKDVQYPMVADGLFKTPGSGIVDLTFIAGAQCGRRLEDGDADEAEDYDDEEDAEEEEEEDEEEDYDDEEDFDEEQDGSTRRLRGGKQ